MREMHIVHHNTPWVNLMYENLGYRQCASVGLRICIEQNHNPYINLVGISMIICNMIYLNTMLWNSNYQHSRDLYCYV